MDYDPDRGLLKDFEALQHELSHYDQSLLNRPYLIAVSQIDRIDVQEQYEKEKEALSQYGTVYPFSSFSKEGLKPLLDAIAELLNQQNRWLTYQDNW